MIAAVDRHGYADANISQVIAHAGVSRPTFYDYFADKDDCFIATHQELGGLLLSEIRHAVSTATPERAVQAAILKLLELAEAFPDRGVFLVNETIAGGLRVLDEHDRLIEQITQVVERRRAEASPSTLTPDLPVQTVLAAGRWLLAPPLRRREHDLTTLAENLTYWVDCYRRPSHEHRWHTLEPGPELPPSPHLAPMSLSAQPPLAPGRSRLSSNEVARNQRERIMYATAKVAAAKGYTVATIADITASAAVDRRVFYRHFRDKQQAFLAVHEFGIQQLMAIAASAFFSASEWPERVWQAIRATTQFEATYPLITHIGHIQSHAVGAPAIQRIDDTRAAFTIFLQEGNQYASPPLSRVAMEAIAGAVFEIGYHHARRGQSEQISRLAPNATYLTLAPFIGPEAATAFIDEKLRESAMELAGEPAL
jgi:AcrR family transcriptional regulator